MYHIQSSVKLSNLSKGNKLLPLFNLIYNPFKAAEKYKFNTCCGICKHCNKPAFASYKAPFGSGFWRGTYNGGGRYGSSYLNV